MRSPLKTCLAALLASCSPGDAVDTDTQSDSVPGSTEPTSAPTSGSTENEPKLDLGALDLGGPDCGLNNGDLGLSYIWIANSTEGTVSKIDAVKAANSGEYGGIQRVA